VRAATAWPTSSVSGRDAGIEPFPLAAVRYWRLGQSERATSARFGRPPGRPLQLPASERQFDIAACAYAVPNRRPWVRQK
jgi:hypothetical protein